MEELINEAEGLYLELSRITDSLIYARLHDDNDLLHGCRNELENYAQSVMQTFKCLVDSKDNIVDLGEVWHSNKDIPQSNKKIIAIKSCGDTFCGICNVKNGVYLAGIASDITSMSSWDDVAKWAYLEDLLPRGDNK